jgi:hypothetical protein
MVPDSPTATKVLFPNPTPQRVVEVGEVTLSKDEPLSVDLTMVPEVPTPTKVLFPNPTPLRSFEVGEVTVLKDEPLSVDLTMVPEVPTPTKVLFPNPTPQRLFEVGEVTVLKDEPLSVDLTMVPDSPTPTNLVVSSVVVVVVPEFSVDSSFSSLQEMTVKLKRKRERIMRRCFIGFLIGYFRKILNIPSFVGFYKNLGFYLEGV